MWVILFLFSNQFTKTQCVVPLDTQNNIVSSGHLLGKL